VVRRKKPLILELEDDTAVSVGPTYQAQILDLLTLEAQR
jgi:hypothetical protein